MNYIMVLLSILMLISCTGVGKMHRVIDPLEALQLCGAAGVSEYVALSGIVTCRKG